MYIRFITAEYCPESASKLGLIVAAHDLIDDEVLDAMNEDILKGILKWFDDNLPEPTRLRKSRKYHTVNIALSWYKPTAINHISKMYELKSFLELHGITTEVIKTFRPGVIVYEDRYQVVAEPFKDT
ncbi:MAG: hypothetical protein EP349_00955 [Alphaproteobacteria bacterium]|nr:MAG: hypothetical protein EP349_00955 [Alphaproteobacteria bacterium]